MLTWYPRQCDFCKYSLAFFLFTDFETKKLHDITKENEAFLNDI